MDSANNVYVADTDNSRIRKVDAITGTIDTVAGSTPGLSGDNATPTAAQLNGPKGVSVDASDNILIADTGNNRVRKVDFAAGLISTVAGTSFGFFGDGGLATSAKLKSVEAVAVNPAGDVFASDLFSDRVRRVDAATQIIDTFAGGRVPFSGDAGPAINAELNHPLGVALDKAGNLYIADHGNKRIRRVSANPGIITTFAGGGSTSGDGIPATDAMLSGAHDVAVHFDTGDVFIAELGADVIRKVDGTTGLISTIAGGGSTLVDGGPATSAKLDCTKGVDVDRAGNVFIASACDARILMVDALTQHIIIVGGSGTSGFAGDGGPATSAQFELPHGVAVDQKKGFIFIADTFNNRIRRIDPNTGIIDTVAGNGSFGTGGDGGPATVAQLEDPKGVRVDSNGDLFIAGGASVRRVDAQTGVISTVAGTGQYGFSGDNGTATDAKLNGAARVALDTLGNLFIADEGNNRVRKVEGVAVGLAFLLPGLSQWGIVALAVIMAGLVAVGLRRRRTPA